LLLLGIPKSHTSSYVDFPIGEGSFNWVEHDWLVSNLLGACKGLLGAGVSICFLTISDSKPIPLVSPIFQTKTEGASIPLLLSGIPNSHTSRDANVSISE
jgi:hypothetical protein